MKKNHLILIMYVFMSMCVYTLSIGVAYASNYVNYRGISMTSDEYNNLINLGFTEDEIYYMGEEMFNQNKNIESSLVAVNEKYYKTIYTDLNGGNYSTELTKVEYDNQSSMNTRGTVETTYKKMVTTMSRNSDNTFRYKIALNWKQFPAVRSYDIIGIGFDDNVYIVNSGIYFGYYYCDTSGNCPESSLYYNKKSISTGGSVVYKLPSGSISALGAVLYYDVSKNNSSQTITELNMCGDYSHATANVSQSSISDYTININGIQLFSIIGHYDAIPCASVTWGGTW